MEIQLTGLGRPGARGIMVLLGAVALSACGGQQSSAPTSAPLSVTGSVAMQMQLAAPAAESEAAIAVPLFHVAPVILDEPDETDSVQVDASASSGPHTQYVPVELSILSTRRLTIERLRLASRYGAGSLEDGSGDSDATPLATGTAVATYTPAQIRAAYGLPTLPPSTTGISTAQAAQLGAGQTVYIVDADDDPNAAAELATFSQKFGLPGCTTTKIATNAKLPLPAASAAAGCTFSVVYSSAAGAIVATAPAYDSGWSTEIALDVQWVHATAPLARIVLIEAPDASANSLRAAVALANTMGPGAVSMSFGAPEGSWTSQMESTFSVANMTYLAAAGDAGAAVEWPAVSPHVVAVGGTSLTFPGTGARSELAWSGSGGGVSQFTATPSYQTSAVPGMGSPAHRSVTDVSFNADPRTGQYLVVISPGSTTASWLSAGGTSLATPQWAGVIAIANALRAQSSQAALGAPHAQLYSAISTVPTSYASDFGDIVGGSDGSCTTCSAKVGYDLPTGLGTPNVTKLVSSLSAGTPPATTTSPPVTTPKPPVVNVTAITGRTGAALSFAVSVTSADSVTYTISGAPSGMSISGSGVIGWGAPVAGKYTVTVTAKDARTGLSGQGVFPVTISVSGPVISASPMTGVVGKSLTGVIMLSDSTSSSVSLTISGVPTGMSLALSNTTVTVKWPSPTVGSYSLTVNARDGNGQTASLRVPVTITSR